VTISSILSSRQPARVVHVDGGLVMLLASGRAVRATLGADLLDRIARDPMAAPCTGDWCDLCHWPDGPVTVERVRPRGHCVVRAGVAGCSGGQVLAANLDSVAVVAASHPEPVMTRLERLLTVAWATGAQPAVVLTKADLVPDAGRIAEDVATVAPGVPVVVASVTTGAGIAELRELIGTGTMALIGSSGGGKSSLVNALHGADVLAIRPIRDDGRGRRTSVRRELVELPGGGAVIDAPGLGGVGLIGAEEGLLESGAGTRLAVTGSASPVAAASPRALRLRPRRRPRRSATGGDPRAPTR
jgi:ribosome biogenesis GTPase